MDSGCHGPDQRRCRQHQPSALVLGALVQSGCADLGRGTPAQLEQQLRACDEQEGRIRDQHGGGHRYLHCAQSTANARATARRTGKRGPAYRTDIGTAYVHTVIDDHSRVRCQASAATVLTPASSA